MKSPWILFVAALARRGFAAPVRTILFRMLLCGLLALVWSAFAAPFYAWWLWFGLSTLFSAWNFFGLAKFIQQKISVTSKKKWLSSLIWSFQLRLFLTGIFVYIALARCKAPVSALVAGLSSLLVFIVFSVCCAPSHTQSD